MDWNSSITPTGFDWSGEDFDVAALYNGFESGSSPGGNKIDQGIIEMEKISASISNSRASISSGESFISLELGKQKVNGSTSSSIPASCTATKRSRSTYQKIQNPCCQVEGCNLNLTLAKDYHRRHRICESHSKSPKVVVAGVERRFCQQCSRLHGLSEFDDNKRSCRRRLSDHNARRRRLQPDQSIHFGSVGASSSLYDRRPQDLRFNVLSNSVSNRMVDNISSNSTMAQAGDSLARPSKTDQIPCSIYDLHVGSERLLSLQSTIHPEALDRCMSSSISSYFVVPSSKTFSHPRLPNYKSIKIQYFNQSRSSLKQDLPSAPSLLSTDMQWSLNRDESTSMEGLMHGNASVDDPIKLPPNWPFEQSNQDEGPSVSTNLHSSSSTSLLQEFDLFKTTYDSGSGCFHSNDQRNL